MCNILKENRFQIDYVIRSKIMCTSCQNILIKPRNVPCGCRYCYDCLQNYLNEEEKFCLGDLEYCKNELIKINENVFIDQRANIKVSRIVVKCLLESCKVTGELRKVVSHMRTCANKPVACPYYNIGCHENKMVISKLKLYSHRNGYKMRLVLDPDCYSKKTHLSLCIFIMQGQFDNILQWPFRHDLKVELMNQETGLAHVSGIVKPEDCPMNESWQKPGSKGNRGIGYPEFMNQSDLLSVPALCRGNQIWIKVTPQIKP